MKRDDAATDSSALAAPNTGAPVTDLSALAATSIGVSPITNSNARKPLKDITYVHEKTSEATKYNLLSNSSEYSPNFKFNRCENGRSFLYQWLLNNNDSELKMVGNVFRVSYLHRDIEARIREYLLVGQ